MIDQILTVVARRGMQLSEDLNQVIHGPGGQTLSEAVEERRRRRQRG